MLKSKNWYIPLKEFYQAYYQCRRRKRNTLNALKFEENYEEEIIKLWKEVNEGTYRIGKSIAFIVTRPKDREIFAADFRDRIVHHVIINKLKDKMEKDFIEDCYSCRDGKGTDYGIKRLDGKITELSCCYTNDIWIGKFDIKGFFMSINKNILWRMLEKYIKDVYHKRDKRILLRITKQVVLHSPEKNCVRKSPGWMWKRLPKNKSLFTCDPSCGLPIGNLTSQWFANFYLMYFDREMKARFGGYYGRYVDDFYVLSPDKEYIKEAIPWIENYLKAHLGLELHPDKRYIQPYWNGVKFIGTYIKRGRWYVGNETRSNFIQAIHAFNRKEKTYESAETFVSVLNSYLGFTVGKESWNVKKQIFKMISPEWGPFIGVKQKKKGWFFWLRKEKGEGL